MRPVSFWTGALLLAAAEAYVPVGRTSLQHADLDRAEADAEASPSPPHSGRGGLEVALGFGAGCAAAALSRRRVLSLSSLSLSLPLQARALGRSEEKSGDLQKAGGQIGLPGASQGLVLGVLESLRIYVMIVGGRKPGVLKAAAPVRVDGVSTKKSMPQRNHQAIIKKYEPYLDIQVYNPPGSKSFVACDSHSETLRVIFSGDAVELQRSLRRTPYLHCMASQLLKAQAKRVLVLGLGGGLLPQALSSFGMEVVAVESSSVVLDLSRRFFGLEDCGVELVHADAEEFVRSTGRLDFDACAIDIFQGHSSSTPAFTRSVEFLRILENSLRPGASVLQNAIDATGAFCASSRGAIPRSRGGRDLSEGSKIDSGIRFALVGMDESRIEYWLTKR
ncbi:unnamed protein product [Effrenium voratum]|nr:unnamed protein product [Effrenium voratum]